MAQETLRYAILSNGRVAGSEVDTYGADGRIDGTFEFNDRGRGPKIAAHYVLGADGLPTRTDVTGNDYLKAPVDEHFAVENGRAHWKSTSEEGSAEARGFYVSNNGPAAESAMLVAVLLKAKGAPVKLYPAGEARLERLTDTTVEDHGKSLQAAVKRYADLGYIQIKLYSSLKPELVPGIAKLAHERGLRLSGHVPNGMIASQFVEAGADEIQHINFIFLNFLASKVKDTRTPERFTAVGANAAKLDLDSKEVKDFIELLLKHHTTVDVTVATFEGMFTGRPGKASPDYAPVLNRLPAQVQRGAFGGGLPVTGETDQLYKDSYGAMLKMTKKMYDAGVPLLAGTDALAGLMLHRELELEVRAGIPAAKALQIATWNAAKLLKQEKELGSVAPGKKADLLLVEGNPVEHISDIRRCRVVMKNGTMYKSDAVYAAVGIKPAE